MQGSGYSITSTPFEVRPASLVVRSTVSGGDLVLEIGYLTPLGYRLLDLDATSNDFVPIRDAAVTVVLSSGTGDDPPRNLTTDHDGRVTISGAATGYVSASVEDRFANLGGVSL